MLPNKYQYTRGRFLAPTVNSYNLQLGTLSTAAPERVSFQKPLDFRLAKDLPGLSREVAPDSLRINATRQGGRLISAQNAGRPSQPPALAFGMEFTGQDRVLCQLSAGTPRGHSGDSVAPAHRPWSRQASHSAGASSSHSCPLDTPMAGKKLEGDAAVLLENASAPGVPVAFRSREDHAASPERLDLDGRHLQVCPLLEGEERLRLLNFQHNQISRIQQLSHLRRLIFLDLYDNRIGEISGLSALTSLHVLMLGKNRITRISNLENLTKLDVLDLHGNQISKLENLSHLAELRVLNLAGNCIACVENLRGLDSLTELNLRRNCITTVTDVDCLPCLQRLFLSCNNITSFDDLTCLGDSRSLSEVTLDGNPVAQETWYKQTALRYMVQLRQLDMKRITEEERRMASVLARKEDEKKRESHKQAVHKEKRRLAIRNAAQQWEAQAVKHGFKACLELPAQDCVKQEVSPEHSPGQLNGIAPHVSQEELRRLSPAASGEKAAGGGDSRTRTPSRPNSPRDPRLAEAAVGAGVQSLSLSDSHLAELDGDTLRLFGPGALEALERGWGVQTAGAVTAIAFRYIDFDTIVPTLPRIRVKFPNVRHLIFSNSNISRLPQLAALAQVRRLDQLTVHPEGNPVVSLGLWRSFAIYRLNHFNLQRINGLEVTMNDVITAERLFGTLGHIAATETPHYRLLLLLEESRKRQLQFLLEGRGRRAGLSPEELRDNGKALGEGLSRALFNYPSRDTGADSTEEAFSDGPVKTQVCREFVSGLVKRAADTNLKAESLHKLWPSLFVELVRDSVLDMWGRPAYRQACLQRISQPQ
ncbi:leucine-rich repeat-containing protein 49 [Lepisosteus oculatus]|uniref:leucine-rich repeat-containing protein 49 n=1 Tax=Lepisosteus oculatus TaxID=7918 RepID=UPI003718FBD1